MLPSLGWISPTTALERLDLPQPDSPTRPSVSPSAIKADAAYSSHRNGRATKEWPPAREMDNDVTQLENGGGAADHAEMRRNDATWSAYQQAVRWPGAHSFSGGAVPQRTEASGQRGAKRQPGPKSAAAGTAPSMEASVPLCTGSARGTLWSSREV